MGLSGYFPVPFSRQACRRRPGCQGFTLTELLVVLAILAVLMAALLPAVAGARDRAKEIECASNLRQIAQGLHAYAYDFKSFPPNHTSPSPGTLWSDRDRIGRYLPDRRPGDPRGVTGRVFSCPADQAGVRSFSMNAWASRSVTSLFVGTKGLLWRSGSSVKGPAHMILLVETWSFLGPTQDGGYMSVPITGFAGMPGVRFGAGGGLNPKKSAGRFGLVSSEIDYSRHRQGDARALTEPKGRANFAYADGHVAMKRHDELSDFVTGRSTLDSWWSALDPVLEPPAVPTVVARP